MRVVLAIMGRTPSLTELGIFSVMWSEHCSYKSSRIWLKKLPTSAPWVIHGPGENAGVVDIGDGLAAVFKMESHNHPSFIEPYQGAATGVGGILRDVFTMGARPIANLNALRFGSPEHPLTKRIVDGVVRGIGGYGNCVGVPTVGGEINFHPAYNGNPLVNAMTVGIARKDRIFLSAAVGLRQSGRLCRLEDRPRRYPRRHHGKRRVRRGFGGKAADRAGRRPVHRKAPDRGLPRTHGNRRHRRYTGHGRRRADQFLGGDGRQGRARHRTRSRSRAAARDRHDGLRDDAVGKPGAHADGVAPRAGSAGARDFREMGAGFFRYWPAHRQRPHRCSPPGAGSGRHPARALGAAGAALRAPCCAAAETGPARGSPRSRRPRGGAAEADRLSRSVFPRLGLGPVRQHRRRPDRETARRSRRRCGPN